VSETLRSRLPCGRTWEINSWNHALVGWSVRYRSQGERRIRGLQCLEHPHSEGRLLK